MTRPHRFTIPGFLSLAMLMPIAAGAAPSLREPGAGTLELVAADAVQLLEIDGLAFDDFGNLFGALEIDGVDGGVVYIDKLTGVVTKLTSGIDRADQIALDSSGDFFVTSEARPPASATMRIYRIVVSYDDNNIPISAAATDLTTSIPIDDPEGLVVLEADGAYGNAGDLLIAEDLTNGRILKVTQSGDAVPLVDTDAGLARPEGLAFGRFTTTDAPKLYAAETRDHNVVIIEPNGSVDTFGDPVAVGLRSPDNVEFGPGGYLYLSEDRSSGRVIRIAADGAHSTFADGFNYPQGLAVDPINGDLYIGAQAERAVYRVVFDSAPPPVAAQELTLFDAALGTLPPQQDWLTYATNAPLIGGSASESVVPGGVRLQSDVAPSTGFSNYIINILNPPFPKNAEFPVLDRRSGFSLSFELELDDEIHNSDNRAGFSVILIANDLMGIEIGFWLTGTDTVWAQSGPDFEHAEGTAFDTAQGAVVYELVVAGDHYRLLGNDEEILSGVLRDYAGFGVPYSLRNFLFLGDDTGSASVDAVLGDVRLILTASDMAPRLTLTKLLVNDDGGTRAVGDFALFIDGNAVTSGVENTLTVGAHTVSETEDPGYATTFGGDCAPDGSITLALGEVKSCTVSNDDIAPRLTLTKVVVNDDGGTKAVGDFTLFVDGDLVVSGEQVALTAGVHTVSESLDAGYTGSIGGDCDFNGNITLAPGDVKSCRITNIDSPDSDGDGLSDDDELQIHETDPNATDTDGDGISDGDEVRLGRNPLFNESVLVPILDFILHD